MRFQGLMYSRFRDPNSQETPDMTQTVARLLAESLEAHESTRSIAYRESYVGLTSALIERNSIRVIVCRHESGGGFVAVVVADEQSKWLLGYVHVSCAGRD
jgi:hypothetical protein